MLPLSLGRIPALGAERPAANESAAWFQPANVDAHRSSETRALTAWLSLFVGLAVCIALGHVWLRLRVVDLGYQLLTTRQLIEKLAQEDHELTVAIATLDAPGRVEAIARGRLGMTRPGKGQEVALP